MSVRVQHACAHSHKYLHSHSHLHSRLRTSPLRLSPSRARREWTLPRPDAEANPRRTCPAPYSTHSTHTTHTLSSAAMPFLFLSDGTKLAVVSGAIHHKVSTVLRGCCFIYFSLSSTHTHTLTHTHTHTMQYGGVHTSPFLQRRSFFPQSHLISWTAFALHHPHSVRVCVIAAMTMHPESRKVGWYLKHAGFCP
jgi:hypothetical protein